MVLSCRVKILRMHSASQGIPMYFFPGNAVYVHNVDQFL